MNLGWDESSIAAGKELIKKYNDFLKKKIKTYETTNYDDYKNELSDFIKSLFPTIENIEKRNQCTVANAIKLADALGVTLDELCRDHPETPKTE